MRLSLCKSLDPNTVSRRSIQERLVAQWIRRLTTNQEIQGSSPCGPVLFCFFHKTSFWARPTMSLLFWTLRTSGKRVFSIFIAHCKIYHIILWRPNFLLLSRRRCLKRACCQIREDDLYEIWSVERVFGGKRWAGQETPFTYDLQFRKHKLLQFSLPISLCLPYRALTK